MIFFKLKLYIFKDVLNIKMSEDDIKRWELEQELKEKLNRRYGINPLANSYLKFKKDFTDAENWRRHIQSGGISPPPNLAYNPYRGY